MSDLTIGNPQSAIRIVGLVAAFALTLVCTSRASAQTLPAGFQESVIFSGLTNPTAIVFASDGRVFVAEKSGLIKVFNSLTDTTPDIFADLRTNVHNFWDRGLLGLALHPNFPNTPDVYVLYTHDAAIGGTAPRWGTAGQTSDSCPNPPGATSDGCVVSGRLSRLQAGGNVMVGTEQVLIEAWCQQYPSHSIGALAFGPDGALYVSGGDGASFGFVDYGQDGNPLNPCGDPPVPVGGTQMSPTAEGGALRSQSLRRPAGEPISLDGAILRVDPATGDALPDNPLFSHVDPNARRIVGYGLRNPFRFTIRPGTNEVWVGDVGWNNWEEINHIANPTGGVSNFGWPCYEGGGRQSGYDGANLNICENLYNQANAVTTPFFTYNHSATVVPGESCPTGSSSISGVAFYNGGTYPTAYDGALFFSDYSRNCIWVMFNPAGPAASTGLVAAYGLNEGSGTTVADASGNGHTGSLVNGPIWTTGMFGSALNFDGINDYVEIANPGSLNFGTSDFAISAWIKRGVIGTNDEIINKCSNTNWESGCKEFYFDTDNTLHFGSYDTGDVVAARTVTDTNWHHVAVTFVADTKAVKIFIDGVQEGSGTLALRPDVSGHVVRIGQIVFSPSQYFTGLIDELRIYNRVLTAAEIQADMNTPIPAAPPAATRSTFLAGAAGPVDLKIGPGGDLFYVGFDTGTIRRIRYLAANQPPTAVIQATPLSGPAPLTVSFDGTGSSDPDPGDTIVSYAWDLDGDGQFDDGSTPQVTFTYTASGSYSVRLQVFDNRGETGTSAPTVITVGSPNNPPTATIDSPAATLTWQVGDVISFSGHATDPEDGNLPASRLAWSIILHHCPTNCHTHPLQTFTGVANGSFSAPDHEYPSHLEIKLTATDSGGRTNTKSVLLDPKTVVLSFQSSPSGLQLVVGSSSSATPFSRTVILGSNNSISATSPQSLGGTTYLFASWSDGGAQSHNITAAGPVTYTATYTAQTTVTAFPSGTVVETGTFQGGSAASLNADDNIYYVVNSTTSGTRTTSWYGSFTGVPNTLSNLKITYKGKNSRNCTQTVAIWRWTDSTWVQLDSRSVSTTEIEIANLAPTGTLSDYVSGTTGDGELRVRVRCTRNSQSFSSSGDLMKIVYDTAPQGPPPSSLVAAYAFNEGAGTTAADASGNGHTGTLVNGTAWAAGKFGSAVSLDGVNDYVSVASPNLPTGEYTWEAWVNPNQTSTFQALLVSRGLGVSPGGLELDLDTGGRIVVWSNGALRLTSAMTIPAGAWSHVALTRAGGTLRLYINGTADPNTGTDGVAHDFSTCPLLIGVDNDSGCTGALNGYFAGRLDEIRIYNRALSATEIQTDMNTPIQP